MLTSSILNSITFKYLDGGNPNKWNTLHADRKQGGFNIVEYCQKFNLNDVVYLQFESDSDVVPVLKSYSPALNETINGTLVSSYSGIDNRYFYNFAITLGASYHNQIISFTVTQSGFTLTSEPIICEDITEEINKGFIKKIKYTNLDRNDSDLSRYWVDWSVIDYMYFYVECVDVNPNDSEESEVLEGSQYKTIVSATNYSGISLETGAIPDYMTIKLKAVSSLDYFEVNGQEYVKDGNIEVQRVGNTTLHECTLNLTEKLTKGLNVDDIGITTYTDEVMAAVIPKRNTGVTGAGWQIENPAGYMLHSIQIKHASGSVGNAVVNIGTSVNGDEIIDDVQGNVPLADWPYSGSYKGFPRHFLKDADNAFTLYVSVSGAGAVLDIIVNFDTVNAE